MEKFLNNIFLKNLSRSRFFFIHRKKRIFFLQTTDSYIKSKMSYKIDGIGLDYSII